jgi:hypothetical protein
MATRVKTVARVEEVGDAEVVGALDDGGSGSSSREAPIFAANGAPSDGLRSSSPFYSPSPSSPVGRRCGQGMAPLGRLVLGAPGGCGGSYL